MEVSRTRAGASYACLSIGNGYGNGTCTFLYGEKWSFGPSTRSRCRDFDSPQSSGSTYGP